MRAQWRPGAASDGQGLFSHLPAIIPPPNGRTNHSVVICNQGDCSLPEVSVLERPTNFPPFHIFRPARLPALPPCRPPRSDYPPTVPSPTMVNTNPLKNLKSLADPQKRKANSMPGDGVATRPVKRRASKACQCCRSRKVRCNVTEHGAPCTNCRLDEVECIVSESRRKKRVLSFVLKSTADRVRKWNKDGEAPQKALLRQPASSSAGSKAAMSRKIASRTSLPLQASQPRSRDVDDGHVPHSICESLFSYQHLGMKLME